jgi:hypothetical protein
MIDQRTGLIDRAWYMFFLSLFNTATGAQDAVIGPATDSLLASFDAQLRALSDEVGTQYDAQSGVASLAAALAALEQQFAVQPSTEIGELQQQIDALAQAVAIQPAALPLNSGAFFNIIGPATAGSVAYGDGSSIAFSAAGSSGQLLASSGTGAPTWTSLSSIGVTSISFGSTGLTPATATSGAITVAGTLAVASGGTGQTSYTNGQLLIGNTTGNTLAKATLTASTGISVTNGAGSITLTNTAPDQVVSLTGAGTTTISGTYPSFTITSNDTYVGTVTSVGLSMPTQFTVTNSPVTSSGTLTAAWNTQTANYVLAGPTSGGAAVPTFRALVAGDVPALSYVSSVSATAPITSTGGLTPTIAVTSAALTKTDDTNVTLTLGGSPTTSLLAATSLTLGWTGTLAAGRLNSNVVQSVTNDTNVTGSIATQALTLGWTGTLAAARLNANVVQSVVNDTNVTGSIATQALTLGWTGTLSVARGGTAKSSWTANGIVYASGTTTLANGTALTFDGTNLATTGTASATKLIPTGGTATGNGMYLPAANTLAWSINGAEALRLDSSSRLIIGGTTADAKFNVYGAVNIRETTGSFCANNQDVKVIGSVSSGTLTTVATLTKPATNATMRRVVFSVTATNEGVDAGYTVACGVREVLMSNYGGTTSILKSTELSNNQGSINLGVINVTLTTAAALSGTSVLLQATPTITGVSSSGLTAKLMTKVEIISDVNYQAITF